MWEKKPLILPTSCDQKTEKLIFVVRMSGETHKNMGSVHAGILFTLKRTATLAHSVS